MPAKLFVKLKNETLYYSLDFGHHFAEKFVYKAVVVFSELITFNTLQIFSEQKVYRHLAS